MRENRLLFITLDELNAQRQQAEASAAQPLNQRAANTAVAAGQGDPAAQMALNERKQVVFDASKGNATSYNTKTGVATPVAPSATASSPVPPTPVTGGDAAMQAEAAVRAKYSQMTWAGQSIDPAAVEREVQAARMKANAGQAGQPTVPPPSTAPIPPTPNKTTSPPPVPTYAMGEPLPKNQTMPLTNTSRDLAAPAPQQNQSSTPPPAPPTQPKAPAIDLHTVLQGQGIAPEILDGLQGQIEKGNSQIQTYQNMIDQGKMDANEGQKLIAQTRDDAIKNATDTQSRQFTFNAQQDQLNKTAIENAKLDAQVEEQKQQNQAQLNTDIAYHTQQVQNTQQEMQNRNLAAKLGINFDTGGLKWMQDEQQKGITALTDISRQASINNVAFSDQAVKISRDYMQNMAQAFQNSTQAYNDTIKNYNDSIKNAKSDYASSSMSLREFYTTQQEKLVGNITAIDNGTRDLYKDFGMKMADQHTALINASTQAKQWAADYTFKVGQANNTMAFDQQKFNLEYGQKQQELQMTGDKTAVEDLRNQYTARQGLIDKVKGDIQNDKAVSAFDSTYRPGWEQFQSVYAQNAQKSTPETKEALAASFAALIHGATSADPQGFGGIATAIGQQFGYGVLDATAKSGKNLDADQAYKIGEAIFAQAQARKGDAYARAMAGISGTNRQFTDPNMRVMPSDVGIPMTPLHQENIQAIDTMLPDVKNQIQTYQLGGNSLTTTREMQMRLQTADQAFFTDMGQHLDVKVNSAGAGQSIDIGAKQWELAQPYLLKAGLLQDNSSAPADQKKNPFNPMTSSPNTSSASYTGTALGNYIANNGFRVTQDFNGQYDRQAGYTAGAHQAYDIAPPKPGQTPPIPAYTSGTVIEAGSTGPYGNHIKIDDGKGTVWLYGHMSSLNVKKGDTLAQGQRVGIMGATGQADGVHLHLEAYRNGKPYDFAKDTENAPTEYAMNLPSSPNR